MFKKRKVFEVIKNKWKNSWRAHHVQEVFERVKNKFKNSSRKYNVHEKSFKKSRTHLRTVQEHQSQHSIQEKSLKCSRTVYEKFKNIRNSQKVFESFLIYVLEQFKYKSY